MSPVTRDTNDMSIDCKTRRSRVGQLTDIFGGSMMPSFCIHHVELWPSSSCVFATSETQ